MIYTIQSLNDTIPLILKPVTFGFNHGTEITLTPVYF
jgi:hypothetical protein